MTCTAAAMKGREVATRIVGVGAIVVLAAGMSAAQNRVFQAAQLYSFGGSSDDATPLLAVADVGSALASPAAGAPDKIPDLITANQNQRALALLGNGHGGFTNGRFTDLKTVPMALAAADFDNDTVVDLLVADNSDTVRFLRGNSTGLPFQTPGPPIVAGQGALTPTKTPTFTAVAIGVGQLNNDSNLDAVIVGPGLPDCGAGGVKVLLGDGHGAFASGEVIPTGAGSSAVALWDADGDHKIDYLAVTNACANTVSVLQGDGTGGFAVIGTYEVGNSPLGIAADDLDGNGQTDLIVVNSGSDNIAVLDGLGGGTFNNARFFPSGSDKSAPNGLALVDLNGDGKVDAVVVSNYLSFDVSVLMSDGKGNLSAPRAFVADHQPLAVATGQFDGDSVPDVVTVNVGSQSSTAAVLLGLGDGTLRGVENVSAPQPATAATVGDVDNDGVCDLVATDSNGDVVIYRADPTVGFAPPVTLQSGGDGIAVGRGDFNGDGRLDLVVANQSTMNVSVFLAQIGGGFAGPQNYSIGPGVSALTVGDWNRDGRLDLAVTFQNSANHAANLESGSGAAPTPTPTPIPGKVRVLLGRADGGFDSLLPFTVGVSPVAIDLGDFNKDGKLDLVVANSGSNDLSILLGSGDGTFQAAASVPTGGGPRALAVADFDRDGFDDVAVAWSISSGALVFYGNGHGAFVPGVPLSVEGLNASSLAARDLTGDSIPDLLVTAEGDSNAVFVFVGSGASRSFDGQSIGLSRGPTSVVTADFDGDGRYDAAGAYRFVASLPVLTNILAPAVVRGDANGDGKVSAADAVAVMRELGDGNGTRIEEVAKGGFAAAPGVDANGDGSVTPQDALAVAHRLFPGM